MTLQQITSDDIASWDSLDDISSSLEKRGLKPRPNVGDDDELVMELSDDEFVVLIEAGADDKPSDYRSRMDQAKHTNLVATDDYREFTFTTRRRSFDEHGRIRYQQFSFEKTQFTSAEGEKYSVLDKLNELEYGEPYRIYELYDKREVVKEFYEQFEELRRNLIQEVVGIPEDRGDAKQRYVQIQLDRLIFLYFIQEKNLLDLNPDYLKEKHQEYADTGDVYEEFYQPLFFDMLGEGKQRLEFGNLPYLNGGLFSRSPVEEEFPNARLGDPGESAELYGDILDFLGDWNWHVDERLDIVDEKNLSPEVLGHIFEQTVNQKEMGAYYTPEEITSFMARNTIHPYLVDQLNEEVGGEYEELDEVFALSNDAAEGEAVADGGGLARVGSVDDIQREHVETLYFDILKETHVLDPAVGSGAFLLAAQDVLLDTYLSCLDYFQSLQSFDRTGRIQDELDEIEAGGGNETLHAKYEIILNNLYGVDIDDGAVEICKLRLWLSMVADLENDPDEVEALPNIDFNIRQGNSLIGFTDLVETSSDGDAKLNNWGGGVGDSVRDKYEDIIEAVENHKEAKSGEDATNWRKTAESRLGTYRGDLNEKVLNELREAGLDEVNKEQVEEFSPFHWVLEFAEVYSKGGFDVMIGNPPWDRVKPLRDDYFSKFDEVFRTRLPDDKDEKQAELLEDEEVARGWEEYQDEMETYAEYFKKSPDYQLQKPKIDGRTKPNPNDLSALFFERVFHLGKEDSYISQVLPALIWNSASCKDLRSRLLDECELKSLFTFENHGIFQNIHNQYTFGVVAFKNSGRTESIFGRHQKGNLNVLADMEEEGIRISRQVLESYSPEARIFPLVESEEEVDVLEKITEFEPVGKQTNKDWYMHPYQGIRRTSDADRLLEDEEKGDYPVYGGKNIYQFVYSPDFIEDLTPPEFWSVEEDVNSEKSAKRREREKKVGKLKSRIYEEFGGSGSQKNFVNELLKEERGEPLNLDDVLLDCTDYRIAVRDISNSTNERTLIAAVIPKNVVCHNKARTIELYEIEPYERGLSEYPLHGFYEKIFSDEELFVALGLVNSIPFDFLMRTKIDTTISNYKFKESQVPRLTEGDEWFEYIWRRAAQLNCYGDAFEEMRERLDGIEPATDMDERRRLQAEIDAAAFHAYGLDEEETHYVLDNFHRVENPRMMDEEYFEIVKEKYGSL